METAFDLLLAIKRFRVLTLWPAVCLSHTIASAICIIRALRFSPFGTAVSRALAVGVCEMTKAS